MGDRPPRQRIEICASNQLAGQADLLRRWKQQGCAIEIVACLDQCTRCQRCAFALVDGQFRFAPNTGAFRRNLGGGTPGPGSPR